MKNYNICTLEKEETQEYSRDFFNTVLETFARNTASRSIKSYIKEESKEIESRKVFTDGDQYPLGEESSYFTEGKLREAV